MTTLHRTTQIAHNGHRQMAKDISERLGGKPSGDGFVARCPAHDDKRASLSIADGDDGKLLLKCHAGCAYEKIKTALDLPRQPTSTGKKRLVDTYPYPDANGHKRYEVLRYIEADGSKTFSARQSEKVWNLKGVDPLPYHLPEITIAIAANRIVHYTEGEKDANTLTRLDFPATTNHGGANKPNTVKAIAPYFKGANVVVWPDNDKVGREHAEYVASALLEAGAKSVRIASVPEPHKDISDYIAAGHSSREVQQLIDTAKNWSWRSTDALALKDAPAENPGQAEPPRFKLLHARDLYSLPPLSYLIDKDLVAGGLNVLYGASGAGKSFVALDYALQVAQQCNVVYIAAEGQAGYADRVAAWCQHHKTDPGGLHFVTDAVRMLSPVDVAVFVALVNGLAPKLIVIDTLARCLLGGDENSARDMGLFIDACNRVQRETGAAVLVVHHTGKSGASERGSSALRGAADSMIELAKDDETISLSCSKSKDALPFATRYLRLMESPARDGRTSCVIMPAEKIVEVKGAPLSEHHRKVLEVLTWEVFAAAGAKAAQLWKEARIPEGSIYRVLTSLMRKRYVSQNAKGDPYYITEAGRTALHGENGSTTANYRNTTSALHRTIDSATTSTTSLSHPFRGDSSVVPDGSIETREMEIKEIEWYASQASVQYLHDITGHDLWRLRTHVPEGRLLAFDSALVRAGLYDRCMEGAS